MSKTCVIKTSRFVLALSLSNAYREFSMCFDRNDGGCRRMTHMHASISILFIYALRAYACSSRSVSIAGFHTRSFICAISSSSSSRPDGRWISSRVKWVIFARLDRGQTIASTVDCSHLVHHCDQTVSRRRTVYHFYQTHTNMR